MFLSQSGRCGLNVPNEEITQRASFKFSDLFGVQGICGFMFGTVLLLRNSTKAPFVVLNNYFLQITKCISSAYFLNRICSIRMLGPPLGHVVGVRGGDTGINGYESRADVKFLRFVFFSTVRLFPLFQVFLTFQFTPLKPKIFLPVSI